MLAPWFFQWGRQLAAAAETRELSAILEWLGAACGRSRFSRFFDRALLFSAILLLPLLWRRIRKLRALPGKAGKAVNGYLDLVGYRIVDAYIARKGLSEASLHEVLGAVDAETLLREGGYAPCADGPGQ